jgi:hypothetical protein
LVEVKGEQKMNVLRAFVICLAVALVLAPLSRADNPTRSAVSVQSPQAVPVIQAKNLPVLDDPNAPWSSQPREQIWCYALGLTALYYDYVGDKNNAAVMRAVYYYAGC